MNVSQLAVYLLPSEAHSIQKRTTVPFYNRRRAIDQRDCSDLVRNTTTHGPSKPDCPCNEENDSSKIDPDYEDPNGQAFVSLKPSSVKPTVPVAKRQSSDWSRVAYYTSNSPAKATGLIFLANLGDPSKSGTFD